MRNFTIDRSDTWTSRTRRKLKLLAFWMTAFFIQIGFGQTGTIQIGSGNVTTTADQRIPVSNYVYNYNQQIVTAAEYAAGGGAVGDITKIRYMATSVGTITVWNQWTVYIGHTTKTEFTSTTDWVPLSELTQVFSGTLTPNPVANEWFEIEFTVPFSYTGGNLVVAIHEYAPGWTSAPNFLSYTSTANSGIMYRNDSTNPNPASPPTATYRISNLPQIQFEGVLAPACPAPNAVTSLNLTIDGTTVAGTITPNGASSGYLVLRSTDAVLSDMPEAGSSYAVGSTLGNGIIVYNNTDTSFSDTTASGNTQYYYHAFAYNNNPGTCLINYSTTSLTEDITTCPGTPIVVGASNVRTNGAILNWTSALYADNTGVTYTVNISTSADFNTLFDSDSGLVGTSYTLTGLIANTTYYWRVKAVGSSCDSDWAGGSFVAQSSYSPIAVTGFTADVIADGIGGALNSTTDPVDSTNSAANNAYVSNSFKLNPSSNSITNGLPLNRKINSPNITGLSFILPDYAGNNSLRLPEQNVPGTLMFTEPLKLTDIYFAFTSGDGSCTVTAEILFDDDTNQIIEGIAFTNWDSTPPASAPAIVGNLPRVKRDLTSNSSGTNFKIFQYGLPIDEANQSKNVIGVKFTKTSTGTLSPVANIFAVSGKIIADCPILGTTTVEDIEATTAELNWTLSNAGAGSLPADVTYTVQLYSDAGHTMPVGDAIIDIVGLEYVVTNLTPITTYYYTVTANNGACDSALISGQFTTPPVNDNCSGAIELTVNSGLSCDVVMSGTTLGATQSMAATPCFGNPDDDVWFSFVATANTHYISISNVVAVSGTSTDMYFQVLSGDCDNTASILCSDPNDNTATGLIPGETYFIRVWSYANTSRQTFNICVKTMPPPPINDDCAGAIELTVNPDMTCTTVTSGTTAGATQSMAATPCFGNPDDDVWFSFVATNTKHFISISNVVTLMGTSTDMYFQVLSGSCDSTTNLLCSDPNDNNVSGLTVGETYFIRVWSYGNTSRNSFNICIKTPPPPATNDDCADAISLTVNPDLSCNTTTQGTTLGATQSMGATPCFGNPDDDVWFSFVATNITHVVSLMNVVAIEGTSTDMYFQVLSGACDNTTSILCSDPNSASVTDLTVGDTYFVRVWSYAATSRQAFDICVTTPPPPPINDVCSEAFELIAGNNFNISAIPTTNNSATADSGEPVPSCDNVNFATNGADIWYTVVVPPSGSITLETRGDGSGSITDTGIAAYSGTCGSLTSLGCNADDGDGNFSLLPLNGLTPGEIILVRIWGYNGAQGTFQIAAWHNSIPLPCDAPTDFSSGEITTDSVELSWTGTSDSFTIEYGSAGYTPGTGTAVTEISSPFTLSGLDDNTEYDVYLKGICTANESDWVGPVNFTTLEEVSNPPACDISVTISSPNWGDVITWQLIDGNGDTVLSGGTYPQEGYSDTQTYIAINPPYTLQINHDPNTFFCDNDLDYLVTVGGNIDISGTIFDPCSGGQTSIPLTTDFTACIPSCSAPTALTHTQLSMSSAELFWTSDGDLFEVKWGETGFDVETEGTLVDNLEATTLTLEELIIDTQYQFYVRQDCTETNDGYSTWAGPYSFTVGYCTMAAPMYYDSTGITQVTFGEINNPSNTGLSGISNIYYNNYTDISTDVIAGETYDLSVNVNTSGNWMVWASAWIDWNNDGVFDTNLATNGGEAYNLGSVQNVTNGATNGSPHSITIPNVEPGEYRMRIKAVYGTAAIPSPCESQDFSETEDYTIIVMADSCPEPTNFASGEITTDSVELSWTGTADSFTIEYGPAGFTPGTGTAVAEVSSPFTLSGLDDNTEYDVYLKGICTANESDWVGPVNFTTLEEVSNPPACDISVSISSPNWGDVITWQLIDGNGDTVLSGGTYPQEGYSDTQTYIAINPPYTLQINHDPNTFFCDNDLDYLVTVGGNIDISGTIFDPCSGGQTSIPLTTDFTACIPSCPSPSNLGIANATSDSVDLIWSASSSNADIEWGPAGFTPGTGTMVTGVTSPYTVSSSIGVYQFFVRQNCGGGDISDWAGPYSFTIGGYQGGNISSRYNTNPTVNSTDFCTPEPTITIEVPEGMQIASLQVLYSMRAATAAESGAIADAYMSEQRSFIYSPTLSAGETSLAQGTGFNAGNFNYNRTLTFANGATGSVDFVLRSWRTWEGIAGCNATVNYVVNGTWVIIPTFEQIPPCPEPSNPMLNITGNTVQLSWDGTGTFDIAYGVAPFTPTTPTETDVTSPYTFSNLENNTLYMAYIRTNCTINESAWVGPFYFSVVEPCNIPISINLYDITDSSATVGWVSDGTSFDIEYGLAGFTPTGTATDSDIDNPFTISDLTPATEYDIYIRRNCGALESDWIGPFSFTTLCDVAMPMGDNAQELQLGDSLNNLIITGDNLTWYADENLTEEIDPSTILEAGTYTFLVTASNDNCESSAFLVVVTVIDPCAGVLTPIGDAMQSILEGGTLADLVVEGENLVWYADEDLTQPLDPSTVVENEVTYYVVSETEECQSEALTITVQTLDRTNFTQFAFNFYPNPVNDILNLTSNSEISKISMFNMLGQQVTIPTNVNNTQVDMSGLPTGNYIITITIEGLTKTFKVVKK